MSTYAADTSVSVERSRAEIETTLKKYGASKFGYATEHDRAIVAFSLADPIAKTNLMIRMTLPLPDPTDRSFTHRRRYDKEVQNDAAMQNKLWEQACRSSWRALLLVIKAKLEACARGISTVEREFMADVVTGDGRTIGEIVSPQMKQLANGTGSLKLLSA